MTGTTTSLFPSSTARAFFEAHWRTLVSARNKQPAFHFLAGALLRGRNPLAGFTPITNKVKLANGQKADHAFTLALQDLSQAIRTKTLAAIFPREIVEDGSLLEHLFVSLTARLAQLKEAEKAPYTYVLVREGLSPAQTAVQASHAAWEAGRKFRAAAETPNLVLCSVPDERALQDASASLQANGIKNHLFYEPDGAVGHTALATEVIRGFSNRRHLRGFKLYRR
ncbi:hypothetical protein [Comamonas thiooxydans]|uniref:hypothetical protein n=1 Tax=Comamonas thiooxydans TaxID=363952 RepID=UPI0011871783|nr:hypothetical protein [Comamonas thiooxydans]